MNKYTLDDFFASHTATSAGIDNIPPDDLLPECLRTLDVINSLTEVCNFYLSSGYRSPQVNRLVGGNPNSSHVKAQAFDITPVWKGYTVHDLILLSYVVWLYLMKRNLRFFCVCIEHNHVHIDVTPSNLRKMSIYGTFK